MGLNVELGRAVARVGSDRVVIVSADLPLLRSSDMDALLRSALAEGSAIAPDRHGTGTNALALVSARNCQFHFGRGSFAAHRGNMPAAAVVRRWGLALDVDTPHDFECAFGRVATLGS
jgi:2-phospho-L-lactate guanylyltransferase